MAGTPATPTCYAKRSTGGSVKTRQPDGARRPATLALPADAHASVADRKIDDLDDDQDHRDAQVETQRAHAELPADRHGRAPQRPASHVIRDDQGWRIATSANRGRSCGTPRSLACTTRSHQVS